MVDKGHRNVGAVPRKRSRKTTTVGTTRTRDESLDCIDLRFISCDRLFTTNQLRNWGKHTMKYIVFLIVLLSAQPAFAQQWKDVFNEAFAEFRAKRYDKAVILFEDSYELKPRYKTLEPIVLSHVALLKFDAADAVVSRILTDHPEATDTAKRLAEFCKRNREASKSAFGLANRFMSTSANAANVFYDDLAVKREETKEASRWSWVGTTGVGMQALDGMQVLDMVVSIIHSGVLHFMAMVAIHFMGEIIFTTVV